VFSTNANGETRFSVPGTALAAGQTGALCVHHPTLERYAWLKVVIGP
jgi:hypothetical protein